MRRNRFTQIGLDRPVRLAWIEKASSLALAGNDAKDVKKILQSDLKRAFRSSREDVRGSLDKTITILMRVWLKGPVDLDPLRVGGLELLDYAPRRSRIAIHWGMVMAVYPFWSGVATQVGRLLKLQGTAAAAQVQRRMREQYGERETVSRRTRYVLRSYLDWGVLEETEEKGIYSAGSPLAIDDPPLSVWMIEASLRARVSGSAPLKDLLDNPSLFPFRLKSTQVKSLLAHCPRLDVVSHGLDDTLVVLRQPSSKKRDAT